MLIPSSCFHHKIYSANLSTFLFLRAPFTFIKLVASSLCPLLLSASPVPGDADYFPVPGGVLLSSSCTASQLVFPCTTRHLTLHKAKANWGEKSRQRPGALRVGHFSQTRAPSLHPFLGYLPLVKFLACSTSVSRARQLPHSSFNYCCKILNTRGLHKAAAGGK